MLIDWKIPWIKLFLTFDSKKPKGLLEPFLDYDMPPSSPNLEMVISERPIYPTPVAYEPIPLEQLEDLEAMPSSGIMETKPIYIVNPLKGDQNISGEILPPTEEEVEEALMQANIGKKKWCLKIFELF